MRKGMLLALAASLLLSGCAARTQPPQTAPEPAEEETPPQEELPTEDVVTTMDGRSLVFIPCDDKITPKEYVNLRTEPSTSMGKETVSRQAPSGEILHRTAICEEAGWSRIEYDGEILYVVSSYIQEVE